MSKKQWKKIVEYGFFPLFLVVYPFRHINQGVDLTDTGYSLYNYEMFQEVEASWWVIATYLSNWIGDLLQQTPMGDTLLGMNVCSALLISSTALIAYFLLKEQIPAHLVWLGELLAISLCWCPTVILYNYVTYFLVTLGIFFLYHGLTRGHNWCYLVSGCCLGLNVFVRFPNLVESILILCVWYYGCLTRKTTKKIIQDTGWCVLGYILGIMLGVLPILLRFGMDDIVSTIQELSQLGSATGGSDYSIVTMALIPFVIYLQNLKWVVYMAIPTCFGVVYFRFWKRKEQFLKYCWIQKALYMIGVLVLFRWFYGQGLFNIQYQTYDSMLRLGIIFIMLSFTFLSWCLVSKKVTKEQKLGASMGLLLLIITPFGSNNNIYPILNNLFLIAPIMICMCYLLIRYSTISFAVQGMLAGFIFLFFIQSLLFGHFFVFRGSSEYLLRDTRITTIPRLQGMYTDEIRANSIEELYEFLKEQERLDAELVTLGNLPALHYYFGMSAYLTTAWIDLDSYSNIMFLQDMDMRRRNEETDDFVLIVDISMVDMIEYGQIEETSQAFKYREIVALIEEKEYQEQMKNELFAVYY
ncbi:MAG: hypothetical protein R3Y54_00165 [Eubacteriales bacterium]